LAALTRFRKPVQIQSLTVTATSVFSGSVTVSSLTASTAISVPAKTITLGTAAHRDATSKLNGNYLSFKFAAANSVVSVTHSLGAAPKGWIVVNRTKSHRIWGSNFAGTTALKLQASGSTVARIFVF
jgi:hypothetical protein